MTIRDEQPHARPAHVVLIHRYFHPDTPPYATILKEIAEGLADSGVQVSILSCQPSYNRAVIRSAPRRERLGPNVSIIRWPVLSDRSSNWAKGVNLLTFGARVVWKLGPMKRVDAIMAASTPPVLLALVTSLVARVKGVPFVYHKQDIYPEVTEANGGVHPIIRKLVRAIDAGTDRRAAKVVVLSGDMAETVAERGADPTRITVINNFDPWAPSSVATPIDNYDAGGPLRIAYAGNIGRFQNIERIIRTLRHFGQDERVCFEFIGEGALKNHLEKVIRSEEIPNVKVRSYISPGNLAEELRERFDVGLVSLHPGVIKAAFPSKTMSYLRNGLPVLALVENGSELAEMLGKYGAGWSADPVSATSLEEIIEELVAAPESVRGSRSAAIEMYAREFDEARMIPRWVEMFNRI